MRRVVVRRLAQAEIAEAFEWYRERSTTAAGEFLAEVDRAMAEIRVAHVADARGLRPRAEVRRAHSRRERQAARAVHAQRGRPRIGTGAPVTPSSCVFAHYTGWTTDGKKFDSSRDTTAAGAPRNPISFPQGFRRVIAGWDLGFDGMRVGGTRRLIIPYQLAYGERGRPPVIPPSATLIFDVELMQVADTLPRPEGAPRGAGTSPPCPAWSAVKP